MSRIWIVRHGNTFEPGETPRRIGARTDLPLVESGRDQAHALAAWFADEGVRFDRVLASPLRRTSETAALIVGDSVAIERCDWLAEIDHGPDENRPEPEVRARIGVAALDAWDSDAVPPPGWVVDAERRVRGWRALLAEATGDVLVVTSNGAARFVFAVDSALVPPAQRKLRTGAFGLIEQSDRDWRLSCWDRRP